MKSKNEPNRSHSDVNPLNAAPADRVTAIEIIDGVRHLLVLEQDDSGCYREVVLEPLSSCEEPALAGATR